MRRAAKVDRNQAEIVRALREAGCGVLDLSKVGNGCPDLLVHAPIYPWRQYLLEVKDGKKPPSERKLTKAQEKFHSEWKGWVHVVKSPREAFEAIGLEVGE
jgi:hypothetical protein